MAAKSKDHTLGAQKRKEMGRKVKALRIQGYLPANIYGKGIKSEAITLEYKEFEKVVREAGETSVVKLTLGKKNIPTLISNIQVHPVDGKILHVDFRQVDLKEKVKAVVPIELVGVSPAEKEGKGTLVQVLDEVEVEALPTDFPEKLEVDVSNLSEVEMSIQAKDLVYDKTKLAIDLSDDQIIANIQPLMKEEVVEAPVAAEGEEKLPEKEGDKEGEKKEEVKEEEKPKDEGSNESQETPAEK